MGFKKVYEVRYNLTYCYVAANSLKQAKDEYQKLHPEVKKGITVIYRGQPEKTESLKDLCVNL